MNKVIIGSDEGTYTPSNSGRTITLAGLSFTPIQEQLAYIYNKTQDLLYYAPAEGIAKATISNNVITVNSTFPVLYSGNTLHIQVFRPTTVPVNSAWSIPSMQSYSNATGDFTATITNATKNITITGLNYILEATHVTGGQILKIANRTNVVSVVPLTNIIVSGGVITLNDSVIFVTGDIVLCVFRGPDKGFDRTLNSNMNIVQNPDYGHYTSVEQVIAETAIKGIQLTADATGNTTTLIDATGAFAVTSGGVAVGYTAWQTTSGASATVLAVNSTSRITTTVLTSGASWNAKAYSLPLVNRYEIPMEGYNYLTLHYYLSNGVGLNSYLKIYGTLNSAATADADTSWVDMSLVLLGNASGVTTGASTTTENMVAIDAPITMLKYMLKLVVEYSVGGGTPVNTYNVYIKKSS